MCDRWSIYETQFYHCVVQTFVIANNFVAKLTVYLFKLYFFTIWIFIDFGNFFMIYYVVFLLKKKNLCG